MKSMRSDSGLCIEQDIFFVMADRNESFWFALRARANMPRNRIIFRILQSRNIFFPESPGLSAIWQKGFFDPLRIVHPVDFAG